MYDMLFVAGWQSESSQFQKRMQCFSSELDYIYFLFLPSRASLFSPLVLSLFFRRCSPEAFSVNKCYSPFSLSHAFDLFSSQPPASWLRMPSCYLMMQPGKKLAVLSGSLCRLIRSSIVIFNTFNQTKTVLKHPNLSVHLNLRSNTLSFILTQVFKLNIIKLNHHSVVERSGGPIQSRLVGTVDTVGSQGSLS